MAYFTASCNSVKDNTAFAKKLDLDYPILSDPEKKIAKEFGVVNNTRPFPQRWTYIIGLDGKIKHIDKKVKAGNHGSDIVARLEELKIPAKTKPADSTK